MYKIYTEKTSTKDLGSAISREYCKISNHTLTLTCAIYQRRKIICILLKTKINEMICSLVAILPSSSPSSSRQYIHAFFFCNWMCVRGNCARLFICPLCISVNDKGNKANKTSHLGVNWIRWIPNSSSFFSHLNSNNSFPFRHDVWYWLSVGVVWCAPVSRPYLNFKLQL